MTPKSKPHRSIVLRPWELRALSAGKLTKLVRTLNRLQIPADAAPIRINSDPKHSKTKFSGTTESVDGKIVHFNEIGCTFGESGHTIYVKEKWSPDHKDFYPHYPIVYHASDYPHANDIDGNGNIYSPEHKQSFPFRWRPARSMPAWACRHKLEIVSVECRQVESVTEAEAVACGCDGNCPVGSFPAYKKEPHGYHFAYNFEEDNGYGSYGKNPWCWMLTVKVIENGNSSRCQ